MPAARLAIVLLVAACGGTTVTAAPSEAGPTLGATPGPTEAPSVAVVATAAVTLAPVTAPPVTEPPITAPPITVPLF